MGESLVDLISLSTYQPINSFPSLINVRLIQLEFGRDQKYCKSMKILEDRLPQMGATEQTALKCCLEAIGNTLPVKQIIMFGSRARGTSSFDSDVDLCVVAYNVTSQYLAARDVRRSIGRIRGKPALSIVPISPQRLEEKRRSRDPFFQTLLQEGVAVAEED